MQSKHTKLIKLDYELFSNKAYWWDEDKVLYENVMNIYKDLVDKGFEKDDIEISFQTDCYTCNIKGDNISIEGKINKKISFTEDHPKLKEFIADSVKELKIEAKKDYNPKYNDYGEYLYVSAKKTEKEKPTSYKIEAYINSLYAIEILKEIDSRIKEKPVE